MASKMGIRGGLVGLKSENAEKVFVLQHFLKGQGSHGGARESLRPSEPGSVWGHCGAILHTLVSFWDHFRYMRVALESLWSVFRKSSFFQ